MSIEPKNVEELIRRIQGLTVRDIQIATRNIPLNCPTDTNMLKVADAITMNSEGFKISDISAKWFNNKQYQFIRMCYEYAIIADSAYNPDKGY